MDLPYLRPAQLLGFEPIRCLHEDILGAWLYMCIIIMRSCTYLLPEKYNIEQRCSEGMQPCRYVAKTHLGFLGHWVTWRRKLEVLGPVLRLMECPVCLQWPDIAVVYNVGRSLCSYGFLAWSQYLHVFPSLREHCLHAVYRKPSIQGQHSTGVILMPLHEVCVHCVMYMPVQEIYLQVYHTYAITSCILLLLLTFFVPLQY